ncbi:leucine rich repeat [Seminavis robusta]|uniref:Leucine rich repeat n=1 Tax=Seminavis robusta TaxID=568900 RepID=A0A9N8EXQ0_9STRA|nr:leucine rich repeat [Seminavis robusta]|eukprot:Sro2004_g310430.1 leucine rich repeat (1270) ;mRNA; r:7260-11069
MSKHPGADCNTAMDAPAETTILQRGASRKRSTISEGRAGERKRPKKTQIASTGPSIATENRISDSLPVPVSPPQDAGSKLLTTVSTPERDCAINSRSSGETSASFSSLSPPGLRMISECLPPPPVVITPSSATEIVKLPPSFLSSDLPLASKETSSSGSCTSSLSEETSKSSSHSVDQEEGASGTVGQSQHVREQEEPSVDAVEHTVLPVIDKAIKAAREKALNSKPKDTEEAAEQVQTDYTTWPSSIWETNLNDSDGEIVFELSSRSSDSNDGDRNEEQIVDGDCTKSKSETETSATQISDQTRKIDQTSTDPKRDTRGQQRRFLMPLIFVGTVVLAFFARGRWLDRQGSLETLFTRAVKFSTDSVAVSQHKVHSGSAIKQTTLTTLPPTVGLDAQTLPVKPTVFLATTSEDSPAFRDLEAELNENKQPEQVKSMATSIVSKEGHGPNTVPNDKRDERTEPAVDSAEPISTNTSGETGEGVVGDELKFALENQTAVKVSQDKTPVLKNEDTLVESKESPEALKDKSDNVKSLGVREQPPSNEPAVEESDMVTMANTNLYDYKTVVGDELRPIKKEQKQSVQVPKANAPVGTPDNTASAEKGSVTSKDTRSTKSTTNSSAPTSLNGPRGEESKDSTLKAPWTRGKTVTDDKPKLNRDRIKKKRVERAANKFTHGRKNKTTLKSTATPAQNEDHSKPKAKGAPDMMDTTIFAKNSSTGISTVDLDIGKEPPVTVSVNSETRHSGATNSTDTGKLVKSVKPKELVDMVEPASSSQNKTVGVIVKATSKQDKATEGDASLNPPSPPEARSSNVLSVRAQSSTSNAHEVQLPDASLEKSPPKSTATLARTDRYDTSSDKSETDDSINEPTKEEEPLQNGDNPEVGKHTHGEEALGENPARKDVHDINTFSDESETDQSTNELAKEEEPLGNGDKPTVVESGEVLQDGSITDVASDYRAPEQYEFLAMSFLPVYTQEAIGANSQSPQGKALDWLNHEASLASELPVWRKLQRVVLATLYHSLFPKNDSGSYPTIAHDRHECEWFQAHEEDFSWFCNDQEEVTYVSLANRGLTGSVPAEIRLLSSLLVFDLRDNPDIQGQVPSSLGSLPSLVHIQLQGCNFHGPVPSSLWRLPRLETLGLSGNSIGGSLPSEVGLLANILDLQLQSVGLQGSLPTEIGELLSLERMILSGNNLAQSIPDEIAMLRKLSWMDLSHNAFQSSIPSLLGRLRKLRVLKLDNNDLTGSIPDQLSYIKGLEDLTLHNNRLEILPSEHGAA